MRNAMKVCVAGCILLVRGTAASITRDKSLCRVDRPRPNDCSADSPRPPFFAELINQVGQFLFWT